MTKEDIIQIMKNNIELEIHSSYMGASVQLMVDGVVVSEIWVDSDNFDSEKQ